MTLDELPNGATVVVDANIRVYHFSPDPNLGPICARLVDRIKNGLVTAVVSTDVLADMAHRLMLVEAMEQFGYSAQGLVRRLKRHPDQVAALSKFQLALAETDQIGMQVVLVTNSLLKAAADLTRQHGLLMGDATLVALTQEQSIQNLASHDADFDRVPGIQRYAPS
jgi:predicted nucleic acid-binding protein